MMNFLLRTASASTSDPLSVPEQSAEMQPSSGPATTLERLVAEDSFPDSSPNGDGDADDNGIDIVNGGAAATTLNNPVPTGTHLDVAEEEGFITIPREALPDNWCDATNMLSFSTLDRSFIFPGEQLHILVCLSAPKQYKEIITPFKVAAVMSGVRDHSLRHLEDGSEIAPSPSRGQMVSGSPNQADDYQIVKDVENVSPHDKTDRKRNASESETFLRMEDHKKQTEMLLESFMNSHFFVRLAEPDEPLWSKRSVTAHSLDFVALGGNLGKSGQIAKVSGVNSLLSAVVDIGDFNANASGGMARSSVKCCSLLNGDIVAVLQINVGVTSMKDPVLEVFQFEKHRACQVPYQNCESSASTNHEDPCGELLKWLLPLDRSLAPPVSPTPPSLSSASLKSSFSASSGSQLFSFSNFRSNSMSSISQTTATSSPTVPSSVSKASFDLEDWDRFQLQKVNKSQGGDNEGLLSFRGVSLEPERFSVHCGLEGIYIPGRKWKRTIEIIQPVAIHSFAAECNIEDLLCVQIKNISPAHVPDLLIYLDAVTLVFERAPKGGSQLALPIACIEAGNDYCFPNITLRRGEEHSFILKPAALHGRDAYGERNSQAPTGLANLPSISRIGDVISKVGDQYAVLVSCRCNYTESKLFFKQPTSWRPRAKRDLLISVASEMHQQTLGPYGGMPQLPVQVLSLQVSNLTSEDLSLTVLAPAAAMSLPSVVSLSSAPATPLSPFIGFAEFTTRVSGEKHANGVQRLGSLPILVGSQKENVGGRLASSNEQVSSVADIIPSTGLGCTHLWLQSAVPLGCVPSKSAATVKLELLPLTDGIITLDTLQISVKEKGMTYIPEHSLKIHATSSIATGIL